MKRGAFTLILFLGTIFTALSQSLVLCESHDENGTPSGMYLSWNISAGGGYVYVVYRQDAPIVASSLYLYVDKKSTYSENYDVEETITLRIEPGKNWLVYDYFFDSPGDYKMSIVMDGVTKATAYTSIAIKDGESHADTSALSSYYYESSYILFCDSTSKLGVLYGEATEFTLNANGTREITIYIANDKKFATYALYIDIFDEDENYVDEFDISIDPEWDYAYVKQTFTKPGLYYIDIYTEDFVFVNMGIVTIK